MTGNLQSFGGDWTNDKLERIGKYLSAYTQALKNQDVLTKEVQRLRSILRNIY